MNIVLVILGGGIGALLRYLMMRFFIHINMLNFPYGTLIINIIGSFIIGWLAFWLTDRYLYNEALRIFMIIGVLGAFTTFSSFSLDTLHLLVGQRYWAAIIYTLSSVILCIIAAALGMLSTKLGK